jgi:ParB family transcriptional regulator, chromosome partitioning protein
MATAKKSPARASPRKSGRGRLAPRAKARGLDAAEIAASLEDAALAPLTALVRDSGGVPLGAYREPLGGRTLLLAGVPLAAVQPTPFQRDLSPTHAKRLAAKIDETQSFLDPIIVVRGEDGRLWTPNGRHRLAAAKVLGMKQITALISPDEALAYRILALNTEKAHNLKDRSLEVIRMARNLAKTRGREPEQSFAAEFEAPELVTLGVVYERAPRFAGGAYSALLKKVDRFSERGLGVSLRQRHRHARQGHHRGPHGARLQVAVPAQLRGGAHQPGALPQGEEGRDRASHAARRGADAHGGRGAHVQLGLGVQLRSRLGGGRGRRRRGLTAARYFA